MSVILAAIDNSAAATPVLRAARSMARTLHAEMRLVHVLEPRLEGATRSPGTAAEIAAQADVALEMLTGDPIERLVHAAAEPSVGIVVVGARGHRAGHRPAGHVASAVMTQVSKPVLVVPPGDGRAGSTRFERVLVPLEGTPDSTEAVAAPLQDLIDAGAQVTVVHVFRPGTVPRFWDQAGHAHQSWATEFLAHWCEHPAAEVRLRSGDVAGAILDVAAAEDSQLIVLGWSRKMAESRARVVRDVLGRSEVPVLLAPARH